MTRRTITIIAVAALLVVGVADARASAEPITFGFYVAAESEVGLKNQPCEYHVALLREDGRQHRARRTHPTQVGANGRVITHWAHRIRVVSLVDGSRRVINSGHRDAVYVGCAAVPAG